jgi:hypothetical protein
LLTFKPRKAHSTPFSEISIVDIYLFIHSYDHYFKVEHIHKRFKPKPNSYSTASSLIAHNSVRPSANQTAMSSRLLCALFVPQHLVEVP